MADLLTFESVAPELARRETRCIYDYGIEGARLKSQPDHVYAFIEAFEIGPDADPGCIWLLVFDQRNPSTEPLARIRFWLWETASGELVRYFNNQLDDDEFEQLVEFADAHLFIDREYVERLYRHQSIFESAGVERWPVEPTRPAPVMPQGKHTRQDVRRLESARLRLAEVAAAGPRSNRRTRKESRRARARSCSHVAGS